VVGLEEGFGSSGKIADRVLVVMIKGITKNWKFPFSFYFSDGATNCNNLKTAIEDTTKSLVQANFHVLGFVCDQSATNIKTVND